MVDFTVSSIWVLLFAARLRDPQNSILKAAEDTDLAMMEFAKRFRLQQSGDWQQIPKEGKK